MTTFCSGFESGGGKVLASDGVDRGECSSQGGRAVGLVCGNDMLAAMSVPILAGLQTTARIDPTKRDH